MTLKTLIFAAAAIAGVSAASAGPITGLYNTGVDAAGVATTGNGADLHWSLAAGTAYTGAVNGVFPIGPWLSETSASRWLTPDPVAADTIDAADHVYTFSIDFTVGAPTAGTGFTGRFSSDNTIDSVFLNGNLLSASGGDFTQWTSFASAGGFNTGTNTLTFNVRNFGNGQGSNPAGLRVEFLSSVVPEPATWGLMVAGFGLVGIAARRRTAVTA